MELPMDIPAHCHRCSDRLCIGLVGEDFHGLLANEFNFCFGYGFELLEGVDDSVDVVALRCHSNICSVQYYKNLNHSLWKSIPPFQIEIVEQVGF